MRTSRTSSYRQFDWSENTDNIETGYLTIEDTSNIETGYLPNPIKEKRKTYSNSRRSPFNSQQFDWNDDTGYIATNQSTAYWSNEDTSENETCYLSNANRKEPEHSNSGTTRELVNNLYAVIDKQQLIIRNLETTMKCIKDQNERDRIRNEKEKKKTNRIINTILTLCITICICFSGWGIYDITHKFKETKLPPEIVRSTVEEEQGKNYLRINWEDILIKYPNCIGWLYIPETNISYPIVQSKQDSSYYLSHNAENQYSELGAIFIDATQSEQFMENENTIIYGHSIELIGGIFTDLKNFTRVEYFNERPEFYILTPSNTFRVNIRAFAETEDRSAWYVKESNGTLEDVLEEQYNSAMWYRKNNIEKEPKFVTLSTCKLGTNNERKYVLQGVLEYYMGDIEIK